mmetsp:Transcript_8795/g.14650  ORF Transcript_8795/g.14650 Transcript_8795/m.14650 type:complete len:275 (-) Transcript_8795:270-1094(-)
MLGSKLQSIRLQSLIVEGSGGIVWGIGMQVAFDLGYRVLGVAQVRNHHCQGRVHIRLRGGDIFRAGEPSAFNLCLKEWRRDSGVPTTIVRIPAHFPLGPQLPIDQQSKFNTVHEFRLLFRDFIMNLLTPFFILRTNSTLLPSRGYGSLGEHFHNDRPSLQNVLAPTKIPIANHCLCVQLPFSYHIRTNFPGVRIIIFELLSMAAVFNVELIVIRIVIIGIKYTHKSIDDGMPNNAVELIKVRTLRDICSVQHASFIWIFFFPSYKILQIYHSII